METAAGVLNSGPHVVRAHENGSHVGFAVVPHRSSGGSRAGRRAASLSSFPVFVHADPSAWVPLLHFLLAIFCSSSKTCHKAQRGLFILCPRPISPQSPLSSIGCCRGARLQGGCAHTLPLQMQHVISWLEGLGQDSELLWASDLSPVKWAEGITAGPLVIHTARCDQAVCRLVFLRRSS